MEVLIWVHKSKSSCVDLNLFHYESQQGAQRNIRVKHESRFIKISISSKKRNSKVDPADLDF